MNTQTKTIKVWTASVKFWDFTLTITGEDEDAWLWKVKVEFPNAPYLKTREWDFEEYLFTEDEVRKACLREALDYAKDYASVHSSEVEIEVEVEPDED
jgi:hypothetical protein